MGKSKNHSALHKYKWGGDVLVLKDVCFECGSSDDIHYHHVVPETKGGTKTIPLCIVCHGKVHNRDFMKIKELQKIGIEKAKANGKYLGRRPETMESEEKFLAKPKNQKIIQYLEQGYTYRKIRDELNCSPGTVLKVNKILKKKKEAENMVAEVVYVEPEQSGLLKIKSYITKKLFNRKFAQ